ncbi:hypothetical protein [Spiroplasma endosymbiont of Polydrusus formosus]|uniref:hypothetical protein n=1 Tax=Spiroplasma endosymbiont of Polydrusus formosus TaxID=3139326 RepID=UPI0035B52A17
MSKSTIYQLIEKFHNYGFFKAKNNRTVEENELDCLAKRINPIIMKNNPLKQAVLIISKK